MKFRRRPVLLLAGLIGLEAFLAYASISTHAAAARRQGEPRALLGEGLVIGSDGLGYYAWLRSLLIDGDWSFDNEFDEFNLLGNAVPAKDLRTPLGLRWNQWSVGPALVWSVPVSLGHSALLELGEPWPADGYTAPYQLLVGGTTFLFGVCGLVWLYRACRTFARPERAALAVVLSVLGTTLVHYQAIDLSMAHGLAAAALAGLVAFWLPSYGDASPRRWFLVGLGLGCVCLFRWQLATYAVLPVGEALLLARRHGLRRSVCNLAATAFGALLGVLPQLVAWKLLFGHWLVSPIPVTPHWSDPWLGQVLFGADRSLFAWTPFAALLLGGAVVGALRASAPARGPFVLLVVAFGVQVYVIASLLGDSVSLGAAYGFRFLTESLVVLVPGFAIALGRWEGRRLRVFLAAAWTLVVWNLLQVFQRRYGFIPADAGAPLTKLFANACWLLRHRPWVLAAHCVMGPAVLAWWSWPGSAVGAAAGAGSALPFPSRFLAAAGRQTVSSRLASSRQALS